MLYITPALSRHQSFHFRCGRFHGLGIARPFADVIGALNIFHGFLPLALTGKAAAQAHQVERDLLRRAGYLVELQGGVIRRFRAWVILGIERLGIINASPESRLRRVVREA